MGETVKHNMEEQFHIINERDVFSHGNLGHVHAQTGAQRFAMVSGLNDMFPGNGVQWALRHVSHQQQHVYKPRGIKETARTMGPSKVIY